MAKPNYGFDAPSIIVYMGLAGIAIMFAGSLPFIYAIHLNNILRWAILLFAEGLGLSFFIPAVLMIWSSKVGKHRVIHEMIDNLKLTGSEQVLDVGCGRGLLTMVAAKKLTSGKAVGIDIWRSEDQSNNCLDETLKNAALENVANRVEIKTNDMTDMKFEDCSFDAVISCLAIHNIDAEQGRKKAIAEIARVVKPGGRLALLDFKHTEDYARWLKELGWNLVTLGRRDRRMFPPIAIVHAIKPT